MKNILILLAANQSGGSSFRQSIIRLANEQNSLPGMTFLARLGKPGYVRQG
jgi:hypothetical protein